MLNRADQWLLTRFDLLVGWNRDRGAADQWTMSRAAGEASIATNVAGMILIAHMGTADAVELFASGVLFLSVSAAALAGRRSSRRYEAMPEGALRARTVERPLRRVLMVLTAAMALAPLEGPDVSDAAVALSLLLLDASIYLKAAVPPPPAPRDDKVVRLAPT